MGDSMKEQVILPGTGCAASEIKLAARQWNRIRRKRTEASRALI
jgi:hypothetical protein